MSLPTQLKNVLVLDIETVSQEAGYDGLNDDKKYLWNRKHKAIDREGIDPSETYFEKAGIYAEFGKVIVISVGVFFQGSNGEPALRVKTFKGGIEKDLLQEFVTLLNKLGSQTRLLAHNGKEFDFPYLCRRLLINGIHIPESLNIQGKKPWEISHLDTMELWKFGDWKSYTSLELLAGVFNLPTSKDDIDGSMVNTCYWGKNELERIAVYCQKDVVLTAQVYLKMCLLPLLANENIEYAS